MSTVSHETLKSLLERLSLPEKAVTALLHTLAETDHRYLKDLKINIQNALSFPELTEKEALLLALATAVNEKNEVLRHALSDLAVQQGATEQELAEIYACVSLMNVNNVFYRFRHFTSKEYYQQTPAGIKMSIMANPVLGKEFFELVSLAISALNGCELCVNSHEESVLRHGASEAKVYAAVRLSAIFRGLCILI